MHKQPGISLFFAALLGGAMAVGCNPSSDLRVSSSQLSVIGSAAENAIPNQFIIQLPESISSEALAAVKDRIAARADGSRVMFDYDLIPAFAAELSQEALLEILSDPAVSRVEANREITINTEYPSEPDGLDRTDQRTLPHDGVYNDHGNDGAGTNVYIIDTGIRTTHVEFTGRIGTAVDFVTPGGSGEDCNGHGTHVASTAAGSAYGLAKAATLHAVRVLDCGGSGSYAGVIAGIDHVRTDCANQAGPCVANMSLGGARSQALNDAVTAAVAAGVTFVVAAGNETTDACTRSPASTATAITVGAADDDDEIASFSNKGFCVDIFAPGVSILGADSDSDTDTQIISGTSMASPHVAGAVALYLGNNPSATPADVADALAYSATPGCVTGLDLFTNNALLYNDFSSAGAGQGCVANSCVGSCGHRAPAGCYCDKDCAAFGDCCPDKADECGN
ncbi:MAG: hypothetical protein Tsb0020_52060 [Haliangiales bacterium]